MDESLHIKPEEILMYIDDLANLHTTEGKAEFLSDFARFGTTIDEIMETFYGVLTTNPEQLEKYNEYVRITQTLRRLPPHIKQQLNAAALKITQRKTDPLSLQQQKIADLESRLAAEIARKGDEYNGFTTYFSDRKRFFIDHKSSGFAEHKVFENYFRSSLLCKELWLAYEEHRDLSRNLGKPAA